jgi:hypothetical protein
MYINVPYFDVWCSIYILYSLGIFHISLDDLL